MTKNDTHMVSDTTFGRMKPAQSKSDTQRISLDRRNARVARSNERDSYLSLR